MPHNPIQAIILLPMKAIPPKMKIAPGASSVVAIMKPKNNPNNVQNTTKLIQRAGR